MKGISAKTKTFGILGYPVRHSLSPAMQTAALQALGIDACYLAYEVKPEDFAQAFAGAARLEFENPQRSVELGPGDHLTIAPHERHRVSWTADHEATVWLALHFEAGAESD